MVTRSDLAPERVDEVIARAREELAGTGLADAPSVVVSGTRSTGLAELQAALDLLVRTARRRILRRDCGCGSIGRSR